MRAAAAFLNTTPLDFEGNLAAAREAIQMSRQAGAGLVCLPELCLSGYGCEDWFLSAHTLRRSLESLKALLPDTKGLIVSAGLPFEWAGHTFNCAALMADGRLAGIVPKQHLPFSGIHYEPRWFTPWMAGMRVWAEVSGEDVPFGDWAFQSGGAVIGYEICHDAWVEDRPLKSLCARGANLILCPSASHFALGKQALREKLVADAVQAGAAYVYCNLMGNEAGRAIYDGGAMIAAPGLPMLRGQRFSYRRAGILCADLEFKPTAKLQAGTMDLGWNPKVSVAAGRSHVETNVSAAPPSQAALDPFEEFTQAVSLALYDYLRKSKAKGFTLSLSGGADSAACAVLVKSAQALASAELAKPVELRLTCAYQASAHSGSVTREAARQVAQGAGAAFHEFDIAPLVADLTKMVEKALGRPLSWDKDDHTLQNLQARVRSPGIWALANALGDLLIATNNRSEASAGYATMDGDTSGGLAPIAGIGKDFLRSWLRWAEKGGIAALGPLPWLAAVNAQEPTAELRPPASKQTDEADLMPYAVLDHLAGLALREKLSPSVVFEALRVRFKEHPAPRLKGWVLRFFRLWSQSQWKRDRLAPSFHLDDYNVDPRSWCRFPILSGGFEKDLEELEKRS